MWETVKLGDVCKIVNGSTPSRKEGKFWIDGDVSWFTIDDMREQGRDIFSTAQHVTLTAVEEKKVKLIPANSVLLCCTASIGEAAIARKEMATNQQFNSLTPLTDKLSCEYLYYVATTLKDKLLSVSGSTTISFISMGKLKEITIPLPPLAEQQCIVAKLDAAFAEIDRAVEIEGAKLSSVGALIAAKLESMYNDKRFEQKQLKDICKFVGGSQPPKSTFEYEQSDSNIRLIQIRDYKSDKHLTYIPKDKAKRWCSASDVMIGRYGPPIFQILRGIEGAYNVALMKAVPTAEMDNDYLFYFLSNRRIQSYVINKSSRAAGQSGVNKDALEPYPIYVPPLEEQRSIVQETRSLIAQTDILEKICRDKLEATLSLKSAILAQELQPPKSEAA